jgi:hypothetical protein
VSVRVDGAVIGTVQTNAAGATLTPIVYPVPPGAAAGTRITIRAVDDKSVYPVHLVFTVN